MRLRTIVLVSTLAIGLLAGPLPTEAQQAGKVYRIGFLAFGFPPSGPSPRSISPKAARAGLRGE